MYLRNIVKKKNLVRERQSLWNNSKQDDLTVIRIISAWIRNYSLIMH